MPADNTTLPQRAVPLQIAMNPGSGSSDKDEARATLTAVLRESGCPFEIHVPRRGEPIDALMRRLARAAAAQGGALVAAGGDGTVNAGVNAARAAGVPLGLLPLGTFNYLAREHGVPLEVAAAARVLATGTPRAATMGEVNGRLFFNNAGFGLYTGLIHQRERAKQRFGRHRIVAAVASVASLLAGQRPFAIQTITDGAPALHLTTGVFVACNRLQLEQFGLEAAACKEVGALAVLMLRPATVGERVRLLARTAIGRLEEESRLTSFCAHEFEVRSHRRVIELAVDGETMRLPPPLRFRSVPDAVRLIVPPAPAPEAA